LVLSVFFGLGLMLLTFTQRLPDARQAGLDSFLFGQAAALLASDVISMALIGGAGLLLLAVFWKEFKLVSFDRGFGASLGLPVSVLDVLLTSLLVVAIVIGLQAVGVIRPAVDGSPGGDGRPLGFLWRAGRGDRRGDQQYVSWPVHRAHGCVVRQRHCPGITAVCAESRAGLELGPSKSQPTQAAGIMKGISKETRKKRIQDSYIKYSWFL
jgi:hypothetical protein